MDRIDFTPAVKRLIAERAGNRCSYPSCGTTTSGPDITTGKALRKGVAAHIYSAAPKGPRGRGGLTDEEIAHPENGIWLCEDHAKLVDANDGIGHPAPMLISYKDLHEARVQGEVLGVYPAIGWIHEVEVVRSPMFMPGAKARFGKLNLLFGENATGKTALWKYILGAFDPSFMGTWQKPWNESLDVRISYFRPQPTNIRMTVEQSGTIEYEIDGQRVPFNPLPMRLICLSEVVFTKDDEKDDKAALARILRQDLRMIGALIKEVNAFPHATVRNLRFKKSSKRRRLYADVQGTFPGLPFRSLSGREQERVFIELATAAARASGRSCPTLLVFDNAFILFDGWFDFYSHHLLDPANRFQTIMCLPTSRLDLDAVRRRGWEVIRTVGSPPKVSLVKEGAQNGNQTTH